MKYNPQIHHRRSIRLKGYNYSQAGAYFITICCQDKECRFGIIENGEMILNEFGMIAYDEWIKLSERFSNFELDVFQIMPNHMHGIIVLNVGATARAGASPAPTISGDLVITNSPIATVVDTHTVGDIVGAYKSLVANGCLRICKMKNKTMGKIWQRNYYEHIIKDEQSYQTISNYIINNPSKWNDDKFYVE